MNNRRHPITRLISTANFPLNAIALAGFLFATATSSFGAAPTLQLGFDEPGSVNEFARSAFLTWNAETGWVYKVQSRANLDPATPWVTEEPVLATTSTAQWSSPELLAATKYYRLLSQAEILSVEPAVVDSTGANPEIYILGRCLPTNALVEIGGKFFTPEVINSDGVWARISLNGLPPGCPFPCFSINVVDPGTSNVIATLPNALQVTVGVSQQFLEPPVLPPGAPAPMKAKEKANRTRSVGAGGGGIGSFDGGNAVAGKKGLNAVNVKLARVAGGGGDEDEDCDDERGRLQFQPEGTKGVRVGGRREPDGLVFNVLNPKAARQFADSDVLLHSGEVQVQTVDLFIPGRGLDLIWARTYRSRTGTNTVMGNRWSHSYDISAEQDAAGIAVNDGTGRRDIYFRGTNGIYARDEFFNEGVLRNKIFTLTFPDTGRWEFNPFDGSAASGRLARLVDRNGNTITLDYDAKGNCDQIIDALGRTNTVIYGPDGLIAAVKDFTGRAVTYKYYDGGGAGGSAGDLASVTTTPVIGTPNGNDFPDGKTTSYTYSQGYLDDRENHLLLTIVDPKGQTSETHVYQHNQADLEFLRCVSVQSGTNTPARFSWKSHTVKPGDYATIQCFFNDPVGNVTECFFDSRNRCVLEWEFTGRATPGLPVTDTLNRPTGKLRADDPDSYETKWTWNNDSLCTLVVHAHGTGGSMIYERDFDQGASPRKKGDLRIFRELACCGGADTDGDGVPDTTELTTTFQYDPRFGSPARKGWDGTIKGRFGRPAINTALNRDGSFKGNIGINEMLPDTSLRHKGWDGTIKGNGFADAFARGPRQTVSLDGTYDPKNRFGRPAINTALNHPNRFVISSTDPRGTVTEAGYDAKGNRVKVKFPWLPGAEADFAYNSFGQCTAITNAADAIGYRRVDTADYYTNGRQSGYLEKVIVDVGGVVKAFRFSCDARGNVIQFIDPRGNDTLYTYNALDQCVRLETPTNLIARCATDFHYDANDNLVQANTDVLNELDNKYSVKSDVWSFDAVNLCRGHVASVSNTSFVTNRFDYDGNGNLTMAYSPQAVSGLDPLNSQASQYDERGLLYRCVQAPGSPAQSTDQWDYDANGNRIYLFGGLESSGGERVTRFGYDGFSRCVSVTDALGNVENCAYDRNGNLIYSRVDAESNDGPGAAGNQRYAECRWKYDGLDRRVESRAAFFDPATQTPFGDGLSLATCTYAPNGDCLSVTDDNGHTTRCTYDTAGRLSSITDPKTNVVSLAYDESDNIVSVTQTDRSDLTPGSQQFSLVRAYDKLHRLTRSVDNVGNTNLYSYDSLDRMVRSVDPRGAITRHDYDLLGRKTRTFQDMNDNDVVEAVDVVTTQTWDDNSRLLSTTDANTNTTSYAYDSLDRLIETAEADGTHRSLVWSPRSNLVREEDANGTVITNVYDLCDRLIHRDIAARVAAGVVATTTFETFAYNGLSQLVAATNDVSTSTFAYDSLGRCTRGVQGGLGALTRVYDGVGNCLSMTYPSGRLVTYTYDGLDQVASVSSGTGGLPPSLLAAFEYEGPGRLGRVSRANTVNTRIQWNGLVNPPNAPGDSGWGQVRGINHQIAGGGAVVDRRVFTYDPKQNKTLRAQTAPFVQGGDTTTNVFEYDPLDRLSRAINTKGTGATVRLYALDGNGNRQDVVSNGVAGPYAMEATIPPGDFQMNRYTVTPFGAQSYDANGNLVRRSGANGPTFYHYDYADRLVEVDGLDGGGAIGPVASFSYDALGRRISKTTYPPAPLAPVTTQYVHDVVEYRDSDDARYLEELVGGMVSASFVLDGTRSQDDEVVARFDALNQPQYYHNDDLGSVLALTDAGGKVLERYEYDDFGSPQFLSSDGLAIPGVNASPAGNPFLFHSREWDGETGLYCWKEFSPAEDQLKANPRHRTAYLDPKTGRSTTPVPNLPPLPGMCPGLSAYTFAGDNPWSPSPGVRKMIPVTVPDITRAQRRAAVANGSAGIFLSKGTKGSRAGGDGGGSEAKAKPANVFGKSKELTGHITLIK